MKDIIIAVSKVCGYALMAGFALMSADDYAGKASAISSEAKAKAKSQLEVKAKKTK